MATTTLAEAQLMAHISLNAQDLCRVLALPSQQDLERGIRDRPDIFRWFIKPKVREYIATKNSDDVNLHDAWWQPLSLPNNPGHVIVAAALLAAEHWLYANNAFMFPLKWTQTSHADNIPRSLIEVANRVNERMRNSPRLVEQTDSPESRLRLKANWGLSWSLPEWQDVDLSSLSLSPESAWAPLAMGLASAILDMQLADNVLATGFWDTEKNKWTVGPGTLPGKLSVGYAGGKRLFVVPSSLAQAAHGHFQLHNQKDAQVVELDDRPQDLYAGVLPGLLQAGTEPSANDPQQQQIDWYLSRATNPKADQYYYRILLPAIAAKRRDELADTELADWRPDYLLSIVSHSEVLIPLTTLIFRPRKLKLIYTADTPQSQGMERRFEKIKTWLSDIQKSTPELSDIELLPPLIVDDSLNSLPSFVECLTQIPRPAGRPTVLIDSTPGKRAMQLAMLQGAQRDDRLVCWWHSTHLANRRAVPFSEKMLLWQVAEHNILRPLELSPSKA